MVQSITNRVYMMPQLRIMNQLCLIKLKPIWKNQQFHLLESKMLKTETRKRLKKKIRLLKSLTRDGKPFLIQLRAHNCSRGQ